MLTRLFARDFRNLEELSWSPGAGAHLLLGDNGTGKTSLLEALYVLATTRSFRATRVGDCRRHGADEFLLTGDIAGTARTELEVRSGPNGARRRLNGAQSSLAEHLGVLPVVSWTASDLEWIGGAPAARRRLLDRGVVGSRPAAIQVLTRYRRTLDQKRRLLAGGGSDVGPWNEILASTADELIRLRKAHVEALSAVLDDLLDEVDLGLPRISLRYRPSPATGGDGVETTLAAIEAARSGEIERRSPLVGPHRDELEIRWGDHPARQVASAGERKLLGLAMTAARARLLAAGGRPPVLLLDDLDAELDQRRLAGAWDFFEPFSQVFVTSSRAPIWASFGVQTRWLLACGKLTSA